MVSASVIFTVKLNVPFVVSMPDFTPFELFSFKPAGRFPELIDHVKGVFPPIAVNIWL